MLKIKQIPLPLHFGGTLNRHSNARCLYQKRHNVYRCNTTTRYKKLLKTTATEPRCECWPISNRNIIQYYYWTTFFHCQLGLATLHHREAVGCEAHYQETRPLSFWGQSYLRQQ